MSGQWAHQDCNIIYKTAFGKCIIETGLNEVGFVPQPHSPDVTRHCSHTVRQSQQKKNNIITPIYCPNTHTILVQINTLLFVPPRCHRPRRILISMSTRHGSVQRDRDREKDREKERNKFRQPRTRTRTSQGQRNETKQNKKGTKKKQPDKKNTHTTLARKERK